MENIVILGGGLGGFYVAKGLEKQLKRGEAQVTLVDARCACTYQPFLAEVVSGCIEPRHVLTPLRRHLPRTDVCLLYTSSSARAVSLRDSVGHT